VIETFLPFLCPGCGAQVRGDVPACGACGLSLPVTAWSKIEQEAEDRDKLGLCGNCGRLIPECDAKPCIEETT
jgi:predicted  nucleic acid-binding Zn-ribbon protein